jgi:ATP-dependent Zn protease
VIARRLLLAVALLVAGHPIRQQEQLGRSQDPSLSRREFEARIAELDRRYTLRFDLSERAITVALDAMNRRLDGMNEFRNTLRDQSNSFVSRPEWETREHALEEQVKQLELERENAVGRSQQTLLLMGVFFTILQIGLGIFIWKRRQAGSAK